MEFVVTRPKSSNFSKKSCSCSGDLNFVKATDIGLTKKVWERMVTRRRVTLLRR
jgi:hypothetical protein